MYILLYYYQMKLRTLHVSYSIRTNVCNNHVLLKGKKTLLTPCTCASTDQYEILNCKCYSELNEVSMIVAMYNQQL